ncbi:hypothetical protein FPOAC2_03566 [Fusarium poae]
MNWTEGALARHSRRKGWDKDAARQKQYFAKARAKKNAPSSSKGLDIVSFVPDYIKQSQPQQPQDHYSPSSTPAKKQKTPKRKLIHRQNDTSKTPRRELVQGINVELPKPGGEPTPVNQSKKDHQEPDIATKRRKLLEKDDWTGVNTQKPLMVNSTWRKDRSPRPQGTANFRRDLTSLPPIYDQMKIGSQNLRWSRESNSVRSFDTRHGLLAHIDSSPDRSLNPGTMSPYQLPPNTQAPIRTTIRPRKRDNSPDRLDSRDKLTAFSNTALSTAYGNSTQKLNRRKGPDEPRFVAKAHIPIIHQPQPTRGTRPSMFNIRSPDLEENMSTTAVLGAPTRFSRRITTEDIRWNSWLNSKATMASKEPAQTKEMSESPRSISPGISHSWNSSEQHSKTQSPVQPRTPRRRPLIQTDEPQPQSCEIRSSSVISPDSIQSEMPSSEPELPEIQTEDDSTSPTTLETHEPLKNLDHDRRDTCVEPRIDWVLSARTNSRKTTKARDLLDLLTESEDKNGVVAEKDIDRKTILNPEDEDEIWKRFVFDNDIAETTRRALEEAKEQTKRELDLEKINRPRTFQDLPLASSSTAPRSDVAEPPSVSRDSSLSMRKTLNMEDDEMGRPSGTDLDSDLEDQSFSEVTAKAEFKFHQPQLFIGRLAAGAPSDTPSVTLYEPKKGRRWRKRRHKERPDFRAMPDYDDDPIEED